MVKKILILTFFVVFVNAQSDLNPFRFRLLRCPKDPILKALEDFFDKRNYIKNQVACLTDLSLTECGPDQFCDSCCCDAVGLRLRVLAPPVIADPDEANCANRECVCIKREGRRVLNRLKNGQSADGFKYRPFYDQVFNFYSNRNGK